MVCADMRGKLSGVFNMAGSFGRAIGPAGFAVIFSWSISPSAYDWVGSRVPVFHGRPRDGAGFCDGAEHDCRGNYDDTGITNEQR